MDNERRYFPSRTMIAEPSSPLGDIRINFEVIANIVRLTVIDIDGVLAVGGHWWRRVESLFSHRRDVIDGVYIEEDGDGYAVKVRVQLLFGVEISKVAYEIQNKSRENLQAMANVSVTRIDVLVDGIQKFSPPKTQARSPATANPAK